MKNSFKMQVSRCKFLLASCIPCLLLAGAGLLLASVLISCSDDPAISAYQKADELLSKGQHQKAIKAYKRISEKYQESIVASQAQYKIGQIYRFYLNDDNEAIRAYETLLLMYPYSKEVVSAKRDMAEIYTRQGIYQKAISEYQWLIKNSRSADREKFHYEIAMCYLKMSDATQARIELQELVKDSPSEELTAKIHYQIANTFYIEGKLKDAIKAYDDVIKNYPDDTLAIEAGFNKAVCLEETDNLKDALALYRQIAGKYANKDAVQERISGIEARLKQGR